MLSRAEATKRLASVETNIIDKVVGVFSPQKELERYRARQMMALHGGYTGGNRSRKQLKNWKTTQGADADTDIVYDLPVLRDRSRDLIRNHSLAAGIINTKCTSVVGSGLRLHSEIDYKYLNLTREKAEEWQRSAEREFNLFARRPCNVELTLNFYEIQDLIYRSFLGSGDIFALRRYKKHGLSPYELKLQLIESDRVCNTELVSDTATLVQGIEKDADGTPTKLHVANRHPRSYSPLQSGTKWSTVDYFDEATNLPNVLHVFRGLRPHQSRGVPDLAPVIEAIKELGEYKASELSAAVVSSFFTVFVKSEGGASLPGQGLDSSSGAGPDDELSLGPAAVIALGDDESIETANPLRPNTAFDGFVKAVTREIGMATELPYEVLIKHFTASYSAAQAALLEAWRYFNAQRDFLSGRFCNPVYEMWLYEAIARGRLPAPGFFDDLSIRAAYMGGRWIGQAKGHVNEDVSAKAAHRRILMETSTRKEEAQALGRDYERLHDQRAHEEKQGRKDKTQNQEEDDRSIIDDV